jgi:ATP-dependent helicase/nuclease subunit B
MHPVLSGRDVAAVVAEDVQMNRSELLDALAAGAVVATGNARLSRSLKAYFERRMLEQGRVAWSTPRVLPLGAWLLERYMDTATRSAAPLPRVLLPEQEEQVWAGIIRQDGDALLRVDAAARRARDAWKHLRYWHLDLADRRFEDNENTAACRQWMLRFRAHCTKHEQASESDLPALLTPRIAQGDCPLPSRLLLAGFYEREPAVEGLAATLRGAGCAVEWVELAGVTGSARRLRADDAQHEMLLAASWARGLLEADPQLHIGIVVPDLAGCRSALDHLLRKTLAPSAMHPGRPPGPQPWNLSLGRALVDEPVVATALGLLSLMQAPVDTAALGSLLVSPHWALPRDAAERRLALARRAQLDRRLRATGEAEVFLRTVRYEAARDARDGFADPWGSPEFAERIDGLIRQSHELPDRADTTAWAASFTTWLKRAGWPEGRPLNSAEFQAVEAWNGLLSRFSGLADFTGRLNRGEARSLLHRMAGDDIFQPRAVDAPVQVLGLYEANGQQFDHLWVMGLHDSAWPPGPAADPFIPLALQRERDMPHCDPEREHAWAKHVTTQLSSAAPDVIFSFPGRDGTEELACSPLIAGFREADPDTLVAAAHEGWAGLIRCSAELEPLPAHQALPLRQPHMRGGSRVFANQAACPFRAFAEHRLGARPLDRLQVGLGPMRSGTLMHRALELLWRELQTQEALLALNDGALRALVRRCSLEALESQRRRNPATLSERFSGIEAIRLQERILGWLEIERQRSPFRVVGFEEHQALTVAGVQVNLKLDRIDELEDGARVVLDYKTGQVRPSAWFGERPDDPQLPLYGVAARSALGESAAAGSVAAVAFAQIRPDKAGFSGVVRGAGVLPDLPARRKGELRDAAENWPQVLEDWSAVLDRLGAAFREGTAEVDPKNGLATCRSSYCELAALCRIHQRDTGTGDDGSEIDNEDWQDD